MPAPSSHASVTLVREGAVAVVTLSQPGRLNAIRAAMWQEIARLFTDLSADAEVRCVVVRGADGHFSAGADITEFHEQRNDAAALYHYHQEIIAPALHAVRDCLHPTVALIEGTCLGGGLELACACDLRIGANSARLGAPIKHLGFPMAPAELQILLSVAGRNVALELLLEGRVLAAAEALAKGLLTRTVADGAVAAETMRTAAEIAQGAAEVGRANKQTLRRLAPPSSIFNEAELRAFYAAWADHPEHREGVAAFLEKRPPNFARGA